MPRSKEEVTLRSKNDTRLARRLHHRDPEAIAGLYARYGRLAYSLIFRIVRDAAAAEDLLQETFLRVWSRAHSFDPECGAPGAWILTVARSRALDYVRSSGGADDRAEDPALFSAIDERALSPDRARRLRTAFEKLDSGQRLLLDLACFEGLSETEIAERMNQPPSSVRLQMRGALKALRQELVETAIA